MTTNSTEYVGLPVEQLGETFTDDIRSFIRNNITETATLLKPIMLGRTYIKSKNYVLTMHRRFKQGVVYYTKTTQTGYPDRYYPAVVTVGEEVPADTYYELVTTEDNYGGYPQFTLPRGFKSGITDIVTDTAFDSRWDDGVGMYKIPTDSNYPWINGYNVWAVPRVLKYLAGYMVKMHWRLHVFIDAALCTLIDKFVITVDQPSEIVENNKIYHKYFMTSDVTFQAGKQYYQHLSNGGYGEVTVEVGKPVRKQTDYGPVTEDIWEDNTRYFIRIPDTSMAQYTYHEFTGFVVGEQITNTNNPWSPGNKLKLTDVWVPVYNGFNDYWECEEIPYADYVRREQDHEGDSTKPERHSYYEPVAHNEVVQLGKKYYFYDDKLNNFTTCSIHPVDSSHSYFVRGNRIRHLVRVPTKTYGTFRCNNYEMINHVFVKNNDGYIECATGEDLYNALIDVGLTDPELDEDDNFTLEPGDEYDGYAFVNTVYKDGAVYYTSSRVRLVPGYDYQIGDTIRDTDDACIESADSWDGYEGFYPATNIVTGTTYYTREEEIPGGYVYTVCADPSSATATLYEYKDWFELAFATPEQQRPDFFSGRSLYRRDTSGEYICIGTGQGPAVLFAGKTRNVYKDGESMLFTALEAGVSTTLPSGRKLYVDPEDEDIERVKNVINLFVRRYKTVIIVQDRGEVGVSAIGDDTRYTTDDLLHRINAVVETINQFSAEPLGRMDYIVAAGSKFELGRDYYIRNIYGSFALVDSAKIARDGSDRIKDATEQSDLGNVDVYMEAGTYTVRDMKLKINEIIDFILNEKFYLHVDENRSSGVNFYLGSDNDPFLENGFWDFMKNDQLSMHLYDFGSDPDLIISGSRTYNDRWFFYDRSLPYIDTVYENLNMSTIYPETGKPLSPDVGTVYQKSVVNYVPPSGEQELVTEEPGSLFVYAGKHIDYVPLCRVINVYRMADEWSKCDYAGCMQILDLTRKMLESCTPEGVSWRVAVDSPRVQYTPEQQANLIAIKDMIDTFSERLEFALNFAPHVALVMADIAYHITNVFKMNMRDTVPTMIPSSAEEFTPGIYYGFDKDTSRYVGVGVVNSVTDFESKASVYGQLFRAEFRNS